MIRNPLTRSAGTGPTWLAEGDRIYSYRSASDNVSQTSASPSAGNVAIIAASDNEIPPPHLCSGCLADVSVYQFGTGGKLQTVYRVDEAHWKDGRLIFDGPAEKDDVLDGHVVTATQPGGEVALKTDPFLPPRENPSHLRTADLESQLASTRSESDQRALQIAIQERHTTPFLPLVIALFTAPFSLSLSRKGKAATIGYAVGLWLLFTGTSSVFEQLGLNGELAPVLATWSPLVIFSCLGIFLLTKVRT
jgi:lipopolysaccharide export LptBFGC system permease protein LptF